MLLIAINSELAATLIEHGLPLVMVMLFASAVGLPTGVPIMVILILAGAYLVGSLPALAVIIVVLAAIELAGTLALHLIARGGGARLLRCIAPNRQNQVNATFARWRERLGGRDVAAIAVLRLIPLVRMGTTIGGGLLGIRLRDFVCGSAIAALLWTGVPLSLGYAFRANLGSLETSYARASDNIPVLLGVASLTLVAVVLARSAATQAWLAGARGVVWPTSRLPASLSRAELVQESPPGVR